MRNFPLGTFYDNKRNNVYVFYRHGTSYSIDMHNPRKMTKQQLTKFDLGNLFFFNNEILIVKSSNQILFYRLVRIDDEFCNSQYLEWQLYHHLNIQGFVYCTARSNHI